MDNQERARRYRAARTELNQHGSQHLQEVSQATGISVSSIHNLEDPTRSRQPNSKTVHSLAEYYGVHALWLMGLSENSRIEVIPQQISHATGLSDQALTQLSEVMRDQENRNIVNYLIASERFPSLIDCLKRARRAKKDQDCVDYSSALAADSVPGSCSTGILREPNAYDLYLWKATRITDKMFTEATNESIKS